MQVVFVYNCIYKGTILMFVCTEVLVSFLNNNIDLCVNEISINTSNILLNANKLNKYCTYHLLYPIIVGIYYNSH